MLEKIKVEVLSSSVLCLTLTTDQLFWKYWPSRQLLNWFAMSIRKWQIQVLGIPVP